MIFHHEIQTLKAWIWLDEMEKKIGDELGSIKEDISRKVRKDNSQRNRKEAAYRTNTLRP
jgi:hypothetical protein